MVHTTGTGIAFAIDALFFAKLYHAVAQCLALAPIMGIGMPLASYSGPGTITELALLGALLGAWLWRKPLINPSPAQPPSP